MRGAALDADPESDSEEVGALRSELQELDEDYGLLHIGAGDLRRTVWEFSSVPERETFLEQEKSILKPESANSSQ